MKLTLLAFFLAALTLHAADQPGVAAMQQRMDSTILPDLNIQNKPLSDALHEIDLLSNPSKEQGQAVYLIPPAGMNP